MISDKGAITYHTFNVERVVIYIAFPCRNPCASGGAVVPVTVTHEAIGILLGIKQRTAKGCLKRLFHIVSHVSLRLVSWKWSAV